MNSKWKKSPTKVVNKLLINEDQLPILVSRMVEKLVWVPKKPENTEQIKIDIITDDTVIQIKRMFNTFLEDINATEWNEGFDLLKIIIKDNINSLTKENFWSKLKMMTKVFYWFMNINTIILLLDNDILRKKIVKLMQNLIKFTNMIPIKAISLENMTEKVFNKMMDDMHSDVKTFTDRNYTLTINTIIIILTAFTLIITAIAGSAKIWIFAFLIINPFYYWLFTLLWYLLVFFIVLFIKNQIKSSVKNRLIWLLDSIQRPLSNHELVTEDYILYIRDALKVIKKMEDEEKEYTIDYNEKLKDFKVAIEIQFNNSFKWTLILIWDSIKKYWISISLSILYFIVSVLIYYYFK